jgi:hypothetical protein
MARGESKHSEAEWHQKIRIKSRRRRWMLDRIPTGPVQEKNFVGFNEFW